MLDKTNDGQDQKRTKLPDSTFSVQTVLLIKNWIENCHDTHAHSHRSRKRRVILPTRLIDCGDIKSPKPRLFNSCGLALTTQYVTLSHRWGIGPTFCLTKKNEGELRKSLPFEKLSKTYQDVIVFARAINVRYVWIDSMCIIQDCETDWQKEAARMADYYEGSHCTVAAVGSQGSSEGLFFNRTADIVDPLIMRLERPRHPTENDTAHERQPSATCFPNGTYIVPDVRAWQREVEDSALYQRGWIYQERVLSKRTVLFTRNRVFFECIEQQMSEEYPSGLFYIDILQEEHQKIHSPDSPESNVDQFKMTNSSQKAPRLWDTMVSEFTKRELTFHRDRFAALAGIAQKMESVFQSRYILGLWESHFVEGLTWRVYEYPEVPLSITEGLPSWSFIAVAGQVSSEILYEFGMDGIVHTRSATVLEVDVNHEHDNIWTGGIRKSTIKLKGLLAKPEMIAAAVGEKEFLTMAGWRKQFHSDTRNLVWQEDNVCLCLHETATIMEENKQGDGEDMCEILTKGEGTVAGASRSERTSKTYDPFVIALVLEPTHKQAGQFRRVGLAYVTKEKFLEAAKKTSEVGLDENLCMQHHIDGEHTIEII